MFSLTVTVIVEYLISSGIYAYVNSDNWMYYHYVVSHTDAINYSNLLLHPCFIKSNLNHV